MPGLSLASVVTSNPERAEQARTAHPGVEVLPDADALFGAAGSHDLVVVAAPNREHVPLGLAAVEAGLHLVVDKPLAASVADAQRLADAAEARGVVASVFHNRRWDGDFLTLRRLISDGSLGELARLESRFERWRPEVDQDRWREGGDPEDAGGLLFDLGPHLIDQVLELLGPATSVYAELRRLRPGAEVDDDVFLALEHASGGALPPVGVDACRAARAAAEGARLARRVREVGPRRAGGGAANPAHARAIRASARSRPSRGVCWAARTTRCRWRRREAATSSSTSGWSERSARPEASRRP